MIRAVLIALVLVAASANANAKALTWPDREDAIRCWMVRAALKLHTAEDLEAMARQKGVTEPTIKKLKGCR